MLARSSIRVASGLSLQLKRSYVIKQKAKEFNKLLDKIGDESTKESQKTIKVVRIIGAGSIITVLCTLLWASTLSAPVKETYEEVPDLSKDIRST